MALLLSGHLVHSQCDLAAFRQYVQKGDSIMQKSCSGKFKDALNNYTIALTLCQDKQEVIQERIVNVFKRIEKLRKEATLAGKKAEEAMEKAEEERDKARRQALTSYADYLAYQSQIVYRDGHVAAAFKLAEFAYTFVQKDNPNVLQAIFDISAQTRNSSSQSPIYEGPMRGHTESIRDMDMSHGGEMMATASSDHSARIWNLKSKECIAVLAGHEDEVTAVAMSSKGKLVATGSKDMNIRIFDLNGTHPKWVLKGHKGGINDLEISKDGKMLVSASEDSTAKIWDLSTARLISTLHGHSDDVKSVCFSPDGQYIATGSADHTARLWDARNGKPLHTFPNQEHWITSLAFSPDGKLVATATGDGTLNVWNLLNGRMLKEIPAHDAHIYHVAFHPKGELLGTSSEDGTVKVFRWKTGRVLADLKPKSGHANCMRFSPEGKRIFLASSNGDLESWFLNCEESGKGARPNPIQISTLDFSPKGQFIVTTEFPASHAFIRRSRSGKWVKTLSGGDYPLTTAVYSPDGTWIGIGSSNGEVRILSKADWEHPRTLFVADRSISTMYPAPDSRSLAILTDDNSLVVLRTCDGKILHQDEDCHAVAYIPGGNRMILGFQGEMQVVELGEELIDNRLEGEGTYESVVVGHGGKMAAAITEMGKLELWDLVSGNVIRKLSENELAKCPLKGSRKGRYFAAVFENRTLVYAFDTGDRLLDIPHKPGEVSTVVFHPSEKFILAAKTMGGVDWWALDAKSMIKKWNSGGGKAAILTLDDLKRFKLQGLMDLHPENEKHLLETQNVWQIKAFADLSRSLAEQSSILGTVNPHFKRADRLYGAALELRNESIIKRDHCELLLKWSAILEMNGKPKAAGRLYQRATALQTE